MENTKDSGEVQSLLNLVHIALITTEILALLEISKNSELGLVKVAYRCQNALSSYIATLARHIEKDSGKEDS